MALEREIVGVGLHFARDGIGGGLGCVELAGVGRCGSGRACWREATLLRLDGDKVAKIDVDGCCNLLLKVGIGDGGVLLAYATLGCCGCTIAEILGKADLHRMGRQNVVLLTGMVTLARGDVVGMRRKRAEIYVGNNLHAVAILTGTDHVVVGGGDDNAGFGTAVRQSDIENLRTLEVEQIDGTSVVHRADDGVKG